MTTAQGWVLAVLLAALLAVTGYSAMPVAAPRYEYRIEFAHSATLLDTFGADGWTIVSARWASSGGSELTRDWGYEVVLMRERGRYSALP